MKKVQRAWLHFVGKSYYSIKEFRNEAEKIGVSRAIAPNVLKKMKLGDLIVLAQKDGKHVKIFGTFVFSELIGLNPKVIEAMHKNQLISEAASYPPLKVDRGCGSYVVTGSCRILEPDGIMNQIQSTEDKELGRVMIGGELKLLSNLDHIVVQIPFRQGFRRFDWDAFQGEVTRKLLTKPQHIDHVKVNGYFYVFNLDPDLVSDTEEVSLPVYDPLLFKIENYQLN